MFFIGAAFILPPIQSTKSVTFVTGPITHNAACFMHSSFVVAREKQVDIFSEGKRTRVPKKANVYVDRESILVSENLRTAIAQSVQEHDILISPSRKTGLES